VDPAAFFWTLVLGFGVGAARTFAALRRCYQVETGVTLAPSAFYDRFTGSLTELMREAVAMVLGKCAEPSRALKGRLAAFKDLVLADGSVLRLHDMLEQVYPGCRTNHSKAAAKLHMVVSAVAKGPRTVRITSERVAERRVLPIGPWVEGRLLLFDLGYYRYQLFHRIRRNGGYFISRMKDNANPLITKLLKPVRGRSKKVVGHRLKEVLGRLKRDALDVEVELRFKRRAYRSVSRYTKAVFRLVAIHDLETGGYHLYITNVPVSVLTARDVARTYAARWEIELLFKQLKSHFRLDQFPTRKAEIVEALIHAAILTMVVSRTFMLQLQRRLRAVAERITPTRWAVVFATLAQHLLSQILSGRKGRQRRLKELSNVMLAEMIDPNLARAGGLIHRIETQGG
jgi:IS4 transposase